MIDEKTEMQADWEDAEAERYALAVERIRQITGENAVPAALNEFFEKEAAFLLYMEEIRKQIHNGSFEEMTEEELQRMNRELYEEILPENYAGCWGKPSYACEKAGKELGQLLSFLYMELRGCVVFAFENKTWDMLVCMELFLQIYGLFAAGEKEELPAAAEVKDSLYWYISDYTQEMVENRTAENLIPSCDFAREIILTADLSDLRYLYRFGEYVTENERKTAEFLNRLTEEEINAIARTWTEGYRIGFEVAGKPLHKKKTVNIRYRLGFERVVRSAVLQFREMGLESMIFRSAVHAVNKRQHLRIGYYGAVPNPQFEYDHRNDAVLFMDERFITGKLQALRSAYEKYRTEAAEHGGPAVMEVFGEKPFEPVSDPDALRMTDEAEKLMIRMNNSSGQITNRYIIGEERSFTIIAYPIPEIGDNFEEIFRATEEINNLDYMKYRRIQQKLIDVLDQGEYVRVIGMNGNETDLTIRLHTLEDPAKQTNFENCVADVNIPVGEVFTSPLLTGTNGVLHVSQVYLEEYNYKNLRITVKDGMVSDYTCSNFETEEENRKYIEENILFHHESLPMGEFAIGTNTTAYKVVREFGIGDKMPILIAEKMGPHFAFGDTCYSWQEDMAVYNPDGKEIIARDNERSILRKEDPSKAYFGCHTDITIPYEELGAVRVYNAAGESIPLIENGRFVLHGTEELNEPLQGIL
ncbi:MAG: aminopeptidase [Eubacteriales bacterium]|nr:aminopeptidase [Eubacteriales bacterium]